MQHSAMQTSNSNANREKLLQQNTKLNREICMLESKMSKVITDDIVKVIENQKKSRESEGKMSELVMQQSYMKKLKAKLKQLKALNITDNFANIRREENQLTVLKRQYEQALSERETLRKIFQHKQDHLQYNQPLSNYKGQTVEQLGKYRKKNAEMLAQITELERQIRRYHKYQQLHKALKNQPIVVENPEFEVKKIEHEKQSWSKKSKMIENKWKPQIQAIDKQYFADKEIYERKALQIRQAEKQLKNWQNRASATRSEADVIIDRQRISKVITSPRKPYTQKATLNQPLPKKNKKSPPQKPEAVTGLTSLLRQFKESQKSNKMADKQDQKLDQIPEVVARRWSGMNTSKYGTQSQNLPQHNAATTHYNQTRMSEQNEFIMTKNAVSADRSPPAQSKKKNMALMNSVAVGTSFYYNEDDE